jgi:FtsZ-binding cell division protein ZapB
MGHHGHGFARRFMTKAEKIEKLESYIEQLKNELAGVQERLRELKANK